MKLLQGLAGLVVGAIWGISVMWMGGLYLPNGSQPMLLVAMLITMTVAILLWRKGAKFAAVGLLVGCVGGPAALISLLVHAAATGNVL